MENELPFEYKPFGEPDCESEVLLLNDNYEEYYFHHTIFNEKALLSSTYIIIGRRGSGKTALGQYFSFQKKIPNSIFIDVDEPKAYQEVATRFASMVGPNNETAIPRLIKVWDFVIWSIIFNSLKDYDTRIRDANIFGTEAKESSLIIFEFFKTIINRFLQKDDNISDELEHFIANDTIKLGKEAVLEITQNKPIIIAFDTLENYAVHDENTLRLISSLIECVQQFNVRYSRHNIHLKLFVMAEIYPYLYEDAGLNILKYVKNPIYLHWRPKDLMRLLCWRFYRYLKHHKITLPKGKVENWDKNEEVMEKMWIPFMGEFIINGRGIKESTFPYILRHTQLRPRQLIIIANQIAEKSIEDKSFPHFSEKSVREGVRAAEIILSNEVIGSYSSVYRNIGKILDCLSGMPMIFKGNELDKCAKNTRSMWPMEYSPLRFRQLVAELGIVGKVRTIINEDTQHCDVDFEYTREDRLPLLVSDYCAIHPMFYNKLSIKIERPIKVYPFPDHDEFNNLGHKRV